jgi:hypothetical protein
MRTNGRWMIFVVPLFAGLGLTACQPPSSSAHHVAPAKVDKLEGGLARITLTPKASERLGIETGSVVALGTAAGTVVAQGDTGTRLQGDPGGRVQLRSGASSSGRTVVPYAAVLYDSHGETWVYTSPQPLVFVRHRIEIDHIEGDRAVLRSGPPVGTTVVTVGAAELLGTEFEVGH